MKRHNVLYMSMSGKMMGGGQKSLLLLLERLNREKFTHFLICPEYGDLTKKAEKLGIETSFLKTGRLKLPNLFNFFFTIRKIIKFIKKNNIHIVHTDARRQTIYAGIAAKLTKIILVWHVRISDPEIKLYDKVLSFLATKIVAVSEAAAQRLQNLKNNRDKIAVIHNGINLSEYDMSPPDPKLSEELGRERGCILVGTACQIIPRKGIAY